MALRSLLAEAVGPPFVGGPGDGLLEHVAHLVLGGNVRPPICREAGRRSHTAPPTSLPSSEQVTVTLRGHPLQGVRLPVTQAFRTQDGQRYVIVEHPSGFNLQLPVEWTDRSAPLVPPIIGGRHSRLSIASLLKLARAVQVGLEQGVERPSTLLLKSSATFNHVGSAAITPEPPMGGTAAGGQAQSYSARGPPSCSRHCASRQQSRRKAMNDKLKASHLERRAVVYLRQSTLRQVHEHRESTTRQYSLQQHAIELGWPAERIEVIDEDLGQSGASTIGRTGFQRLAEEVARGQVGAIFALEISRLARSSADWHRLLELCGLADVLIIDEQAIYSPQDYNDRLLLGLKGTMSEAEQYWMRLRLQGGRLSKARRGELYLTPPAGYEWDAENRRLRLDPDEQIRRAIGLVFERFRLEGSAKAVQRYFFTNGSEAPSS